MLKGLKRKLVVLSVLVAAFAAVSSAPAAHARGGVFCLGLRLLWLGLLQRGRLLVCVKGPR